MPLVLHVISGLKVGGAEMVLYRLIVNSRGGRFTHAVIALHPEGAMRQRFIDAGIEIVVLDFKRSPVLNFFCLISLLRRRRPDIVQTWMYHADLLGGLAARMAGNRNVIWGVRSTEVNAGGLSAIVAVRKVCALLSWWVPHSIVCAAEVSRRAHVAVGYDAARMVVIPNGFDLAGLVATAAQRTALRETCGFGVNDVVVGSLGRFNQDKDQKNFVCAAGRLAQQNPQVRFLLVGRDLVAGNAELARWLVQTGHANRFVLLGERADVPACLAATDIFCLSSRTEGFPNVVGEAMAMGLPCVVTDVGDAAMLVADVGEVVPKEDSVALALGLARVLEMTPDARQKLGQKAKARIQAKFTIERARERFETLYEQVIVKGGR
jgi:glycosyltransferase involved in cell wall biosynthesis